MRKLELSLEQLEVESFTTTKGDGAERGTVHGHDTAPGSGVGCASYGCDSASGLEWCICENEFASDKAPC